MFSSEGSSRAVGHTEGKVSCLIQREKPLVLVAEDHEDTRFMLRMIFEMKGCRVVEACDGLQAVEVAGREQPDLILIDGSLPLLDSLAAMRSFVGMRSCVKCSSWLLMAGARSVFVMPHLP